MKCLRVAFVLSALLLASSAWGENMSPEWKEMKEVVDRCLDFFGKTTDDMKNIFKNGTLDESTDFPAARNDGVHVTRSTCSKFISAYLQVGKNGKIQLCLIDVVSGLQFNDEDNDKFSLSALLRFMTAGLSRKGSEVIVKHIATFADECGRKSESSPLPVLEKAKFLINCLLSQDWSSVVSDEDDDENEVREPTTVVNVM
ncbi:MAM and LDL-receptor class A domain-containing protein 1 [Frankliniella fusca]|uniref:MAM and LDL-receptor class A domain-containing protein 1 n=1 Tax=Frankliniella fusca TaxID=407009 RepID=A0AAE1LQ12_9NEOP|nr:MAM and LDL-receptor class A domain-containing protein 1 [Frankliniella fusca]